MKLKDLARRVAVIVSKNYRDTSLNSLCKFMAPEETTLWFAIYYEREEYECTRY
jgi:hypothetical protein